MLLADLKAKAKANGYWKISLIVSAKEKATLSFYKKNGDDLLIDLGPDIMSSFYEYRIDLSVISVCLQTHPHEDHYDPELIISRHPDYGARNAKDFLSVMPGNMVFISPMTVLPLKYRSALWLNG